MNISACEDLATKAELQELRDQINTLLGRTATGNGSPIDVLTQGNLDNTSIATKLVKDIQITQPTEAEPELKVAFVSGDTQEGIDVKEVATNGFKFIGQTFDNGVKLTTTLFALAKDRKLREEVMESYSRSLADFVDSNSATKAVETAIRKDFEIARANDFWGILDRADGNLQQAKQNTDVYKQNMEVAKQNIETLKGQLQQQNQTIDDLLRKDYFQDRTIDVLRQDIGILIQQNKTNYIYSIETRRQLEIELFETRNLLDRAEDERADLRESVIKFQDRLTLTETELDEVIDLYDGLAVEQTNMKARIEALEAQLAEPEITDSEPVTPTTIIRKTWRTSSGGNLPPGVRTTIYQNQQATLDIARSLAGNPDTVTTSSGFPIPANPTITWEDIVNEDDTFENTFQALKPNFFDPNNFTQPGEPQVTPDQLDSWGERFRQNLKNDYQDISNGIIVGSIAPPLNDILNQTRPENIGDAVEETLCKSSTEPNGCLRKNIKDPLENNLNNLGANLGAGFSGLNTLLNNSILAKLNTMQEFLNKAWGSTTVQKSLNTLNTVLAFHNAVMLSRNLVQSVEEVANLVLDALPIPGFDNVEIDIDGFIGAQLTKFATLVTSEQAVSSFVTGINSANRILVAGQGVISATQGIKNALQEGQEIIANRVGTLGNEMQNQGLFEDDTYPWMSDNVDFKNPFSRITGTIQNLTEFTDEVNSLVQTGLEVQQGVNEAFEQTAEGVTASQELQEAFDDFNKERSEENVESELESESPTINNIALIKKEGN